MVALRLSIDTREVKDALAALRKEGPGAVADAMNRVAFEILDAVEIEVRGAFQFASPNTQRFLSRGFRFDKATADSLRVTVLARTGSAAAQSSANILARQVFGAIEAPKESDVGPIALDETRIAVPADFTIRRSVKGRIPAALLPDRLLLRHKRGRTKGYIAGRSLYLRVKGQERGKRLYSIVERVKIKPTVDFFGVVFRTAQAQIPKKAARVLEKINLRRGR